MTLSPSRHGVPSAPRPYRPPIGIPEQGERNRWQGLVGSLGLHLMLLLALLVPVVATQVLGAGAPRAAGGPGAAGGGGGGTRGTGGIRPERVFYVPVAPAAPAPAPTPQPAVPPPKPVVTPPKPPPPLPQPPPVPAPAVTPPPAPAAAPTEVPAAAALGGVTVGEGGGTGSDGSAGSGPGRGGGIGSGIGTGRGSGIGPGTGGGADSIHPPTLVTLALPPLEVPKKLRPYRLVALFDVDERGTTKLIGFNETPDGRFNRKVRDVLAEARFRPAVRMDGRPVRDTGRFEIEYP